MLTPEVIQQNKMKFIELLSKLGIDLTDITEYMNMVDYFNKPASYQYFKAYPGGLVQYQLDLYYELAQLVNAYCPGRYSEEDVIKVACFRDFYRAEMCEVYEKNQKNDATGQWDKVTSYRTTEKRGVYGDIGLSSYMVAKHYVSFTDEQIEAILHSHPSDYNVDIHLIKRAYPLVALTCMADIAASYID